MKAVSVVLCEEATGVTAGRVARQGRRDIENEEIQMYLSKLKDLVPFMPKNRKLSKLEVIQNVIEYICDLQTALETHPALDAAIAAVVTTNATPGGASSGSRRTLGAQNSGASSMSGTSRQPLGVRSSPNTILSACEAASLPQHLTTTPEKLSPSSDGRPVSC